MVKVDYFVVGAPKCGTSSLYVLLKNSGRYRVSDPKELHFFNSDLIKGNYYGVRGIDNPSDYAAAFSGDSHCSAVDMSPSYLVDSREVAKRIHDYNPAAKIVVITREPVDRAISHFLMDVRLGVQPFKSIKSLIETSPQCRKEYIENSKYDEHIERFRSYFGPNVHVFSYEALFKFSDADEWARLSTVFGLESSSRPSAIPKQNSYKRARFSMLSGALRKSRLIMSLWAKFPSGARRALKVAIYDSKTERPEMPADREYLAKEFYGNNF